MNKEFTDYLEKIGMSNPLIRRVEEIYNFYHDFVTEEITNIFVTDFIKEDGNREYDSLWLFSKNYAMEAKAFISRDDFDMTPLNKQLTYWSIEKQEYDFKTATAKSRIHIEITFATHTNGILNASKENCDFLRA